MIPINVSIIIPVYNASDYIETCISSVMRQTYPYIECIIVDDATPDDSIEKCERLITNYQGSIRFDILHHEQCRGVSAARNTGTDAAKGDYIFYLDSDDEITEDCIEILVKPLMIDKTIEIVHGNYYRLGNYQRDGNVVKLSNCDVAFKRTAFSQPYDMNSNEDIRTYYYCQNRLGTTVWNKLVSRSFIRNHNICFKEGIKWEDGLWLFYVIKYLKHLYFVPDYTYIYKIHPNSIVTSTKEKERLCYLASVYEDIFSNLTPGDKDREVHYYLKPFCRHYLVSNGDPRFHNAYEILWEILSGDKQFKLLIRLYIVRVISKYVFTRWLFKQALAIYRLCRNL